MSLPLKDQDIADLKEFINIVKAKPWMLNDSRIDFVKEFIEELGGTVPLVPGTENNDADSSEQKNTTPEPVIEEVESEESDVELDMTGVIEPDTDEPQEMGNFEKEPTEEEMSDAQEKRSEAQGAFIEKDYNKAVKIYTDAILLNPQAAVLYAKRGQAYLMLNKPNACIRDCDRALDLNPDSAAAHKFRGRAHQLLGNWQEAATDLRLACKFDFDEQADEWLKEVTPNAHKLEEHKRKKERKQQEKNEKERMERIRKAREAQAKAQKEKPQTESTGPGFGSLPEFLNDPYVIQAFKDPEIMAAFSDISADPLNITKYQRNKKVMDLIRKVSSKFESNPAMADMAGMAGGMPGGFPGGFPGAGANPTSDSSQPSNNPCDDVGLD